MGTLLHRHQGWIGALALILGFAIAASPTFAPPLAVVDPEPKIREFSEAFGVNYVDENIAMRELNIADFRMRSHEDIDSESRREARALLPGLERELGELRCLR
jgi:hypothetical protein